jgi:hypothetical protein
MTLLRAEEYEQAEPLFLAAHTGLHRVMGAEHDNTRWTVKGLIELYDAWGKPQKAAEYQALLEPAETAEPIKASD